MDFFALLVILLKASHALRHCSDDWPDCVKGKNTVCLREEDCSAVDDCEAGPMTYKVRKKLVDLHNQLRNHLAGGDPNLPSVQAANMMVVSYDSDLQHTADCHINRCQWGHDDCRQGKNTVCERGEKCGPTDDCEAGPMNADVRKKITAIHNKLRNQMAGGDPVMPTVKAANMMVLSYDSDLQYTATCHINRCKFDHDKCRGTKKFKVAGQNLFMSKAKSGDQKLGFAEPEKFVETGIQAWYDEIKLASPTDVDAFQMNLATGHWTQLIWAETTHLGCAISAQFNGEEVYLACNYGPEGNLVNKKIADRGEPCSKCPLGIFCNQEYKNLCGEVEGITAMSAGKESINRPAVGLAVILLKCAMYMVFA
nr:unnamed protein product [Callosobruchus chinensis]